MNPADGPVLRDIHLPAVPGWWPPAPGWWLVAGAVLCLLVVAIFKLHRLTRERRRRRAVLHEFERCVDAARNDPPALAAALSQFLRRMALTIRPVAAAYAGERWLEYLDAQASSVEFRSGVGRVLLDAPFRPALDYDTAALIALVRRWTRHVLESGAAHA